MSLLSVFEVLSVFQQLAFTTLISGVPSLAVWGV